MIHSENDIEVILRNTKGDIVERKSLNKAARVALLEHLNALEQVKKTGKIGIGIKHADAFHKYTEADKQRLLTVYENRVFPFSKTSASTQWNNASCKVLGKVIKDDVTGWNRMRPHMMRKYMDILH
jgi:hypothetical protein